MDAKPYKGLDNSRVLEVLDRRVFSAKSTIFIEGEFGSCAYIIVSGEVDIITGWGSEHQRKLSTIGPGHFIGELALFNHGQRSATVYTEKGCELVEFSQDRFNEKLNAADPALKYWIDYLAHRIIDLSKTDGHFTTDADLEDHEAPHPAHYSHPAHMGHVILQPKKHRQDSAYKAKARELKEETRKSSRMPRLNNVRSCKITDIETGTCVAADILDHNHILLAQAGTVLTDRIVKRLTALYEQGDIDTYIKIGDPV